MKPYIPQKLPPQGIDWQPLIPLLSKANRALAQYDGVLYGVQNPSNLLSPLTTREGVLSSNIEGSIATMEQVLLFEVGDEPNQGGLHDDIKEVLNYRKGLMLAEKALRNKPFHLNFMKRLHKILLDSVRGRDKNPGEFRMSQNWIGRPGTPFEEASFVPPEPSVMLESISDWEVYYHSEYPDALVQLAILHAQFEIIHPFNDGNGRIGRIIIPIFLYEKNLLSKPMFYLSEYLEENRDLYIDRLRALDGTNTSWENWIIFFLEAIIEQAKRNANKAKAIIDLYEKLKVKVSEITHSQYALLLLDAIFKKPIFEGSSIANQMIGNPSRVVIGRLLKDYSENGLIKALQVGSGRRSTIYAFPELLNICEGKQLI